MYVGLVSKVTIVDGITLKTQDEDGNLTSVCLGAFAGAGC